MVVLKTAIALLAALQVCSAACPRDYDYSRGRFHKRQDTQVNAPIPGEFAMLLNFYTNTKLIITGRTSA